MQGETINPDLESFTAVRTELIGLAYRMTGSLAQAEDIAQDAFLRWRTAPREQIETPRSYLLKTAARLSLDYLKSARVRREAYVGPWLPEPLVEDEEAPQQAAYRRAQDVSVAMLLTLQRLTPAERAVFILHDLFDTPFPEIAALLHRTEASCRKLASRARAHLEEETPRHEVDDAEATRIATAFHAASAAGDLAALQNLLAADAIIHTDGGGIRPAALNLIEGLEKALRFFSGIARKRPRPPELLHAGRINGLPGFVTLEYDGLPQTTTLEVQGGLVTAVYIVRNPEKLGTVRRRFGGLPA
ncbi:Sigma-70 region 2 [Acetobacteraceae bacterium AT-5844]|nr:Sigma-70 region 2 [Acetobacteraceae bacterium AT-5844]